MSAPAAHADLPVTELAAMIRELEAALRDGTWKQSPVGGHVDTYLRSLRWGGAPDTTMSAYTHVLALMSLRFADWPSLDRFCDAAGTEYILNFLESEWGGCAPATKGQRTAIVRAFFQWAAINKRIPYNPAATIKAPRGSRRAARQAYDMTVLHKLVAAQGSLREQCALQLLCRLGLRKNELRLIQLRHVDLARDLVYVQGKGGKDELLPLRGSLRDDVYLYLQARGGHPDEFLLYPRGNKRKPMDPATVHRWFKRCLAAADLPDSIQTHELRHSAADAIYRLRGDVAVASTLLRHSHVGVTDAYLHPVKRDLTDALDELDAVWGAK